MFSFVCNVSSFERSEYTGLWNPFVNFWEMVVEDGADFDCFCFFGFSECSSFLFLLILLLVITFALFPWSLVT